MRFYQYLPNNTVLCLLSPTASGKTDLACQLYQTGRFELISVDSALIYQDMNIGTAKPSHYELECYPHHLVNIINPTQNYSVANFVQDVKILIDKIHQNGKIPLLVGGTMLYFMALFDGLSAVPDSCPNIRKQVFEWQEAKGIADLYTYLQKYDPDICQKLKITDTQRITRAVEVLIQTGKNMSFWQKTPKQALSTNKTQFWLGLLVEPDRAWLHERIAMRLELMWQAGLVDEVVNLLIKYPDLTPQMPSMRCVGYRQVLEFLALSNHFVMQQTDVWLDFSDNIKKNYHNLTNNAKKPIKHQQKTDDLACQEMKNKALYATRQLAKRQATWQRQLFKLNTVAHIPTITNTHQELFLQKSPVMVRFNNIKEVENYLLSPCR